ncbi:MAG: tRNA uridine-5-carboxymethylaminomethyl(34) synthesis GTPase MnmE [Spirochaetales bacterium]|nr:tRNA uridine-5-carboxymethylaminomethyl(34) synthesis GTPase MnmE [Spirochaetales bacterium]
MEDLTYSPDDCICALATPWGKGAIGLVRISGTGAIDGLLPLFSRPKALSRARGHSLIHGTIIDPVSGESVDEVMIAVYRAPKSYTGQDSAEIMCHGSLPGIRTILDLLRARGYRDAGPGEFTMRAFLNGKLDLTRAEAVNELISAKTRSSHRMAFERLKGSVFNSIEDIKQDLVNVFAEIELHLDYPEDEIDAVPDQLPARLNGIQKRIADLLSTYDTGKLYRDGVRVTLAGPTNAGKSSLFNLFVKEDRALVSDVHGTTRDYLTELLTIRGIPVTLVDTAGLRASSDTVEAKGIERSRELMANSDVVLFVWDSTVALDEHSYNAWASEARHVVGVWNKTDLDGYECPEGFVGVSAQTGRGFADLEEAVFSCITADTSGLDAGTVIDSDRQKGLLEEADAALVHAWDGIEGNVPLDAVAVDIQEALRALGEITGEVSSRDVLNRMFGSFCVGK